MLPCTLFGRLYRLAATFILRVQAIFTSGNMPAGTDNDENVKSEPTLYTVCIASGRGWYEGRLQAGTTSLNIRLTWIPGRYR